MRPLNAKSPEDAKKLFSDLETFGVIDFQVISKASSRKGGFMKSTKAMQLPNGCLVQVSTINDGKPAEALTFVPGVEMVNLTGENDEVVGRGFVPIGSMPGVDLGNEPVGDATIVPLRVKEPESDEGTDAAGDE